MAKERALFGAVASKSEAVTAAARCPVVSDSRTVKTCTLSTEGVLSLRSVMTTVTVMSLPMEVSCGFPLSYARISTVWTSGSVSASMSLVETRLPLLSRVNTPWTVVLRMPKEISAFWPLSASVARSGKVILSSSRTVTVGAVLSKTGGLSLTSSTLMVTTAWSCWKKSEKGKTATTSS